jgi:hypothetical protein
VSIELHLGKGVAERIQELPEGGKQFLRALFEAELGNFVNGCTGAVHKVKVLEPILGEESEVDFLVVLVVDQGAQIYPHLPAVLESIQRLVAAFLNRPLLKGFTVGVECRVVLNAENQARWYHR